MELDAGRAVAEEGVGSRCEVEVWGEGVGGGKDEWGRGLGERGGP